MHETHHQQPCRGHALESLLLHHAPPAVSPCGEARRSAPHCVVHPPEDPLTAQTQPVEHPASVASNCPLHKKKQMSSAKMHRLYGIRRPHAPIWDAYAQMQTHFYSNYLTKVHRHVLCTVFHDCMLSDARMHRFYGIWRTHAPIDRHIHIYI